MGEAIRRSKVITGVDTLNRPPIILSFLKDLPNLITLLGLSCGVLGIYFGLTGNFPAAVIAMLWAVLFDWYDGTVARRIPERSRARKAFGARIDSLVDLVSLAVCPAVLLLSYGNFQGWLFPGALLIIMAGVIRLAYFDSYGVAKDGTIAGLSLDITPLILGSVFLLDGILSRGVFLAVLYSFIGVLSLLHIAPLRMRKMGGRWYYTITLYILVLTVVYAFKLIG